MEVLIMAGQLILGLSILVGLHEWGHMAAAKMFGMRVEKYFIGFPPKIFSIQRGETEYGIGAIPLRRICQNIRNDRRIHGHCGDEPGATALGIPLKPAWQRLIVMLGGIIVNVIVGIFIFIVIAYNEGDKFLSINEVNKYGIVAGDMAEEIGLKTGDKIVKVNGKPVVNFNEVISSEVFLGSNSSYTVSRDGREVANRNPE
jgi:regulator of sigma E protease